MDHPQQQQTRPNTKLEKKLLEQLFQGGVRETNRLHESYSTPNFPNQERTVFPKERGNEQKGSKLHLRKIGEKILETRSLRKKMKESLTVRQLCARFPELEEDTICAAFAAHGGNKNLTINYLSRALGSCSTKESSFCEDASLRCSEEQQSSKAVQESQVDAESRFQIKNEVTNMEKPIVIDRAVEQGHLVSYSAQSSSKEQTNSNSLDDSVLPCTNNMAFSRRRTNVKSKKYSDDHSKVLDEENVFQKQPVFPVDMDNNNGVKNPKTNHQKSRKQWNVNSSSRLGPEDMKLLNSMPRNAKQAFYKRMKKFHEDIFFKEYGCGTSHNSLDEISVSKTEESFENGTQSSIRQPDSEDISSRFASNRDLNHESKDSLEGEYLASNSAFQDSKNQVVSLEHSHLSFQVLEKRLTEWNGELQKLKSDMESQIIRLDRRYDNIHQLLDDTYSRVHQMECKLDELKQTNKTSALRQWDSYWSSSFWLLLDGVGFILWYCLLKPIVLLYGLFCGKEQRHHRHGSRDSTQFASGDLSKTLAFLMSSDNSNNNNNNDSQLPKRSM